MHATNSTHQHLQDTLGTVFRQFARLINSRQTHSAEAMSRTDYVVLATVENAPDEAGMRISQVAAAHGQDVSTISRRARSLESAGLLERRPDPHDGRASTARLTSAGRTALSEERAARTQLLGPIIADWPEADLAEFDRLLDRLSSGLEDALASTPSSNPALREGTTA